MDSVKLNSKKTPNSATTSQTKQKRSSQTSLHTTKWDGHSIERSWWNVVTCWSYHRQRRLWKISLGVKILNKSTSFRKYKERVTWPWALTRLVWTSITLALKRSINKSTLNSKSIKKVRSWSGLTEILSVQTSIRSVNESSKSSTSGCVTTRTATAACSGSCSAWGPPSKAPLKSILWTSQSRRVSFRT